MTSKTKIDKKLRKKENPYLVKLIMLLKKQKNSFWISIANLLASPKRKAIAINIERINKETKPNDIIIIPGKILSQGELEHALTIACLKMSDSAREKLKKAKMMAIEQLLKQNSDGKGIKIIR